jgi:AraC-like DNA-binding protein
MLQPIQIAVSLFVLLCAVLIFYRTKRRKANRSRPKKKRVPVNGRKNNEHLLEIVEKMEAILENKEIYKNSELSIQDLAEMIGTNRSYVSSSINIFYNQNFCTYINQYRLNELKETIVEEEGRVTQKELAIRCGFGSIDTMKRAIKQKTGLTMKEWKESIIRENQENCQAVSF